MTGRTIRIPGLRFDKTGKLVRDGRRLSVSARLRQNGSSACGSSAEASLTDATVVRRTTKRPPASVSIAELNETTGVRPCVACGERPRLARCCDARRASRPTPRATASSPRRRWGSRRRRSSVAPARLKSLSTLSPEGTIVARAFVGPKPSLKRFVRPCSPPQIAKAADRRWTEAYQAQNRRAVAAWSERNPEAVRARA
jgi:hypothetical protein